MECSIALAAKSAEPPMRAAIDLAPLSKLYPFGSRPCSSKYFCPRATDQGKCARSPSCEYAKVTGSPADPASEGTRITSASTRAIRILMATLLLQRLLLSVGEFLLEPAERAVEDGHEGHEHDQSRENHVRIEQRLAVLDDPADAAVGPEVLAQDGPDHREAHARAQAREDPREGRGEEHVAHEIAAAAPHHPDVVDQVHVDFTKPGVRAEEDDEEDEAHHHGHLGGEPDPEPHDEEGGESDPRHGVEDHHQRLEQLGEKWREGEEHAHEHPAQDPDGEADDRLLNGGPEMDVDEAAGDPAADGPRDLRGQAHEGGIEDPGPRPRLPAPEEDHEQDEAAAEAARPVRAVSNARSFA